MNTLFIVGNSKHNYNIISAILERWLAAGIQSQIDISDINV